MGGWPRRRFRQCRPQPYACAVRLRRLAKAEAAQVAPLFADIKCDIIDDTPGVLSPDWLIKETGDAYAFVVERRGLKYEEVEVYMEQQCFWDLDLDSEEEGARLSGPTQLSICCKLAHESGGFGPEAYRMADTTTVSVQAWKFSRRFLLPPDIVPEAATAAHEDGVVTVMVPRKLSSAAMHRTPLWWAAAGGSKGAPIFADGLVSQHHSSEVAGDCPFSAGPIERPLFGSPPAIQKQGHYDAVQMDALATAQLLHQLGGNRVEGSCGMEQCSDQMRPTTKSACSAGEHTLCAEGRARRLEIRWVRTYAAPDVFPEQQARWQCDLMECS